MASYREIVTKTVLGKGKKLFTNHYSLALEKEPSTILGLWVINHKFQGFKENDKVRVKGSCDVNVWYSFENDTKTEVAKQTINYDELLNIRKKNEGDINNTPEVVVRSLKEPTCTNAVIKDGKIEYDIEKELGIELVGDSKVRVQVNDEDDVWDIIEDDNNEKEEKVMNDIQNEVKEDFLNEK